MSEQKQDEGPALRSELVALKKRFEALEARVTELEKELRETKTLRRRTSTAPVTPALRWWLSPTRHVARHRGFSDLEAEHKQLTVNARRSPRRVLAGDATDERPDLRIDRWTTASVSALPAPVELEALTMPADYGLGLHDEEGVLPVWPQTAQRDPECAVRLGQPGAFGLALHNGQLLSQGEVLERQLALRLQARSRGRDQGV